MKKLAPFYTECKFKYENGKIVRGKDEEGFLLSKGIYRTKIKAEDLPEWYFEEYYSYSTTYFSAKGIQDMVYYPNYFVQNHLFKYDSLLVSYDGKINAKESMLDSTNYEFILYGFMITDMVLKAHTYSDFDSSDVVRSILKKISWYRQQEEAHTNGLEKLENDLKGIIHQDDR